MNLKLVFSTFLFFSFQIILAQETIKPIALDKSVLSGVGLKKIDLKDEPEKDFYQKRLFKGTDISVYVVSTETWNNKMNNFPFDEFVYMFHGEAIVKPKNGSSQLFHSGDFFFAPKGFTGEWEIIAGKNLHYELSVITNQRADSSLVRTDNLHKLFDRSKLSGVSIELDKDGRYFETLHKGLELTISLVAEKPMELNNDIPAKEKLVHLLSGQVTISDKNNQKQTFYTGDFFIIPKGFTGNFKSDGHGLVKYLIVEKTIAE